MRYEDYLMWRYILGDSKNSGFSIFGALIGFMLIVAGFGATIELALEYIPKWFSAFYLWTEPFRTLFFQDFFLSLAVYLLPIGVIYTVVHIIYEDQVLDSTFIFTLIAGAVVGVCRIIFRISTGNWISMPDTDNLLMTVFVWFPVGLVYYLALGALILFGAFTIMGLVYMLFSIVLNVTVTKIAQIRYDKDYNKQYRAYVRKYQTPSRAANLEMRIIEDTLNENFGYLHEPEYNPPVITNAHEKLFLAVIYPICLFFVVWFAMCFGGCIYLLI